MKLLALTLFASLTLACTSLQAADIAAGKTKAAACAGCHGASGISAMDLWPNLAGQKIGYIKKQLQDFQSGVRKDPIMAGISKPLSGTDIENLAAYYNSLK